MLGAKSTHAAEAYVLGLFQLYPTVYFHKTTRGAEKIFSELLFRLITLVRDGASAATGLPNTHPLVRFATDPDDIERALEPDDTVVWGALSMMADGSDALVSGLSKRLRDRELYKCIDVRTRLGHILGEDGKSAQKIDAASAAINAKLAEWVSDHAGDMPRILIDEAIREPYKRFQESKGPLNQIRIRTAGGRLVDLGERSPIVAAIEPFRLFRTYFAENDDEARAFIEKTIGEEAKP